MLRCYFMVLPNEKLSYIQRFLYANLILSGLRRNELWHPKNSRFVCFTDATKLNRKCVNLCNHSKELNIDMIWHIMPYEFSYVFPIIFSCFFPIRPGRLQSAWTHFANGKNILFQIFGFVPAIAPTSRSEKKLKVRKMQRIISIRVWDQN